MMFSGYQKDDKNISYQAYEFLLQQRHWNQLINDILLFLFPYYAHNQ